MLSTLLLFPWLAFAQLQLYSFFTGNTFNTLEGWTVSGATNFFSTCGAQKILGGFNSVGNLTSATIFLELPPHYKLQISLDLWKIDTWDNETFFLYIDQQLGYTETYSNEGSQICGLNSADLKTSIVFNIIHNFPSALIFMTSDLDQDAGDESWGFKNFKLSYYPCPSGCLTCEQGDGKVQCIFWALYESNMLETSITTFNADGWVINGGYKVITQCSTIPLFGGYLEVGQNDYIMKKTELPPHHQVKLKFRFFFLDSWNNERAFLSIDDVQVWNQNFNYKSRKIQDLCGWVFDDILFVFEVTVPHSSSTITIKFTSNLEQDCQNESYGIRDFQLFIPCQYGDSFNQACAQICGNGILEITEICDDGNIYPFDGCFNCEYSCVEGCFECLEGICLSCLDGWDYIQENNVCTPIVDDEKITIQEECDDLVQYDRCFQGRFRCPKNCLLCQFGLCQQCQPNFYLIDNYCQEICQNLQFISESECDDYNLEALDSCHQCQIDTSGGCLVTRNLECILCKVGWELDQKQGKCFPICGDIQIVGDEECDIEKYLLQQLSYGCNTCQFSCQDECANCIYGKCYECIVGWNVNKYKCYPICGDGNIFGLEECDDSNQIRLDGCSKCKNDCSPQCTYCVRGQCLDCLYGWDLNDNFQCEKECGDHKIALISDEECDDQNLESNDDCYLCKSTCCEYCSVCYFGICYDCDYTFTLQDQQCIPICGDGLVTVQFEDCDDMNDIQFDGCFQCHYQCEDNCEKCSKGTCLDKCLEEGFYEIDNQCITICGDGIIAGTEDCEITKGSNGCLNCKYICPLHCQNCIEGQCRQCDTGYELLILRNECSSSCGDGMVSDIEECDDENNNSGDGCSQFCQVETDYICQNFLDSFSECSYELYPEFQAIFLKQDFEKQYVLLHFSQPVKSLELSSNFSSLISTMLVEIDQQYYNTNLVIIQDVESVVMEVQYIIEIEIYSNIIEPPHLEVILPESVYNINNAPLRNLRQIVRLKPFKYLDDQKKQSAQQLQNVNRYLLSSLGGSSILFLVLGNSILFQSLIEIIQQQSYLRFINVQFPLNLFIYFESNNIISLQPLIEMFSFNTATNQLVQTKYVESYEKLKFYEINADIFTNIQGQILILIFGISFYLFAYLLIQISSNLKDTQFNKIGEYLNKLIFLIRQKSISFKKKMEKQGMIIFGVANCWDLLLISFLQIKTKQQQDIRTTLQTISAYFILYAIIFTVSTFFKKQPSFWQVKRISLKQKYFQIFTLLKKFLFLAILILFQLDQKIQSLLLSFISSIYLMIALKYDPFDSKFDYRNFLLNELSVCIFCLTSFFYWDSSNDYFDFELQTNIGWFHIVMLLSVLFMSLISQVVKLIKWMRKILIKQFQKKKDFHQQQEMQIKPIQNIMDFRF